MKNYETVSEALHDLYQRGYNADFSLLAGGDCIYCHHNSHSLQPDEFVIDEVYRFEGETDPGDEMVIYALSSEKYQIRGTLLNAYGMYADTGQAALVAKLNLQPSQKVQPIKRVSGLLQLSREHHYILLLSWKIKTGLDKHVELFRIRQYLSWFYRHHLLPHFEREEQMLFRLPGADHQHCQTALEQHRHIRAIIENPRADADELNRLQQLLRENVRFEERVLFRQIQQLPALQTAGVLQQPGHEARFSDNESDPFWK